MKKRLRRGVASVEHAIDAMAPGVALLPQQS